MRKHVREKLHTCDIYQFLTMRCLDDVLTKTMPYDVFDDVLKEPKHRGKMHNSNVFMTIFVPRCKEEVQVHSMQQAFQSKY